MDRVRVIWVVCRKNLRSKFHGAQIIYKETTLVRGANFFATGVEIFHPPILFLTKKGKKKFRTMNFKSKYRLELKLTYV